MATLGHRPAIAAASCTLPAAAFVIRPDPAHGHHHTMLVSSLRGQGSALRAPRDPAPPHTPRLPLRHPTNTAHEGTHASTGRSCSPPPAHRTRTARQQPASGLPRPAQPLPSPVKAPPCLGVTPPEDVVVTLHDATTRCQLQHRDISTPPSGLRSLRRAHSPDLGLDTCTHRHSSP